jgi:hypothetical protein
VLLLAADAEVPLRSLEEENIIVDSDRDGATAGGEDARTDPEASDAAAAAAEEEEEEEEEDPRPILARPMPIPILKLLPEE